MSRLLPILIVAALLAGCGSSESDTPPQTARATGGTFPAKAVHRYGTTTVPSRPERVVVVGLSDQDTVLQLGYTPVGISDWYGDQPYATWPWAQKALGEAKPTVLHNDDGYEFEKIASLRPDLIIGVTAGMQRKEYETLSKIAPTVAGPKGGTRYFSPWDEVTQLIADSLGKSEEGEQVIADVRADYAKVADANPAFAGKTVTFAQNGFYNGLIYAYQPGLNTEFLTMLGFEVNRKLTPLVKNPGEQVGVSAERLDVLDADVMLFATEKPSDVRALEKVPTFDDLDAVKGNRTVFTDATLSGALYFMTPLSLDYALERLAPQLRAAAAGEAPRRMVDTSS